MLGGCYSKGMRVAHALILVSFALVLGLPLAIRPEASVDPPGARSLVIITPHNQQIRAEFERAFSDWHEERFGDPVSIDWRQPGGTSDIRRQLQAQYRRAIAVGDIAPDGAAEPGVMPYDLLFGGGSYEHDQMKRGVSETPPGASEPITVPMSVQVSLSEADLAGLLGENAIGAGRLWDPDRYWVGNALSGFGIVYNRDALRELGLAEPRSWTDLTDPRYEGWLALADPRQSGSVSTTYDSILNNYGWDEGWRILRAMSANARYFANSSPKVPIDVSQGEAAAGVAIDFYGRYQAQAVMREGESAADSRVGYVDPPGEVFIDPDPISKLRGGASPELADRFIEFVLSEEGQALWQLPARERDGLGPVEFELRRMPIRRDVLVALGDRFVDRGIDPFEIASATPYRGWRSAIAPMMSAFGIDTHDELVEAWEALHEAELAGADPAALGPLRERFYAMPDHEMLSGEVLTFNEANYQAIKGDWRARAAPVDPQHPRPDGHMADTRIAYTGFFRTLYREVARDARALARSAPQRGTR